MYRVTYQIGVNEPVSRIVVAASMGSALTALANAIPSAVAQEVRTLGLNALIVNP